MRCGAREDQADEPGNEVGEDGCGNEVLTALRRDNIDIGGIEQRENVSTAVCVCLVSDYGESSILWHVDDDVAIWPETIGAAGGAISQADTVLLTFEMPPESIRAAISAASDSGTRVVVQPARSLAWDRVDVLVCNEGEARVLVNGAGSGPVADCLVEALAQQLGVPTIAVTLGASGCVVYADGRSRSYPAPEVVPVDTTGAGDAFVATFAGGCGGKAARWSRGDAVVLNQRIAKGVGTFLTGCHRRSVRRRRGRCAR